MEILNEQQINRIYETFDFEEEEEIVLAYLNDGQLYIEYIVRDSVEIVYQPDLSDEEGIEKLEFILRGETQ